MILRFFQAAQWLVSAIGLLFWRIMGIFFVITGSVLMMRELNQIWLGEREVMTFTNVGLRLGMNPYAGVLLVGSMIVMGIVFLSYRPMRRILPRR